MMQETSQADFAACSATISRAHLSGHITVPTSKSEMHRALIVASLSEGTTELHHCGQLCDDEWATIEGVRALGATVDIEPSVLRVSGITLPPEHATIDARESGTTLRLLLPLAAALGITTTFKGTGRLPKRPLEPLLTLMREHGVAIEGEHLPLAISGQLTAGTFRLPGTISSQYISGLLMALPLLPGESTLELSSPLESGGYVDLTLDALDYAGVSYREDDKTFATSGPLAFSTPSTWRLGGDWSSASVWLVADALGAEIHLEGLDELTYQPDAAIRLIFERFGVRVVEDASTLATHEPLDAALIDLSGTPDLGPALAVLASQARGVSDFTGAARLRLKESDRLAATAQLINALGGRAEEFDDALRITGPTSLQGARVDGVGDHRIVMAAAIAACFAQEPVTITDAQAVKKSYPSFFDDLIALGGAVTFTQEEARA